LDIAVAGVGVAEVGNVDGVLGFALGSGAFAPSLSAPAELTLREFGQLAWEPEYLRWVLPLLPELLWEQLLWEQRQE
jgi:hypothetical protein